MYEEDGKENENDSRLRNLFPQLTAPPDFITTTIQLKADQIRQEIADKQEKKMRRTYYEKQGVQYFGAKGERKMNLEDSDSTLVNNF